MYICGELSYDIAQSSTNAGPCRIKVVLIHLKLWCLRSQRYLAVKLNQPPPTENDTTVIKPPIKYSFNPQGNPPPFLGFAVVDFSLTV